MSQTIKVADLYRGESIRAENGSEIGMPIFGKFASIVRRESLDVIEHDDGTWYVRLPLGSSIAGENWSREHAIEQAHQFATYNNFGWTTNLEQAREKAIADAKKRHDAKCAASSEYKKHYGQDDATSRN